MNQDPFKYLTNEARRGRDWTDTPTFMPISSIKNDADPQNVGRFRFPEYVSAYSLPPISYASYEDYERRFNPYGGYTQYMQTY